MLILGVLASGSGSNFQSIIGNIESGYLDAKVSILISDNPDAGAIERAKKHGIDHIVIKHKDFPDRSSYNSRIAEELKKHGVELVILAGFMRVVDKALIDQFPERIMNIHPALLPAFPGLHGQKQAADYGVKISGCTVHFVDEGMDTGPIIVQAAVPTYHDDDEDSLGKRILKQEHRIFPYAIKLYSEGKLSIEGRKVIVAAEREDSPLQNPPH